MQGGGAKCQVVLQMTYCNGNKALLLGGTGGKNDDNTDRAIESKSG